MTPLARILLRQIEASGPMRLDAFMSLCLLHPEHGYYTRARVFGAAGDFVTAPEISQMFGELIGLALAQAWIDQGRPSPVVLAEAGPGRGTLMADLLRAWSRVPGLRDAAGPPHLVEASPLLRDEQARRLAAHAPVWHDRLEELPDGALLLVANEFLDALPVRQFLRTADGWAERLVGVAGGRLAFGFGPSLPRPELADRLDDTVPGDIVEVCPALPGIIRAIGQRIAARGGLAVLVDYGGWRSRGDTFQAVRAHGYADPLAAPGQTDLTAHVDFEAVARIAAGIPGLRASPMIDQGPWLERIGIAERAAALAHKLSGSALESHLAAFRRLTHPDEMGSVFKVMLLSPANGPPPPGQPN